MGRPVVWEYALLLEPSGPDTKVRLRRVQQGTDTQFQWLQCAIGPLPAAPAAEDVLQALYTAVLAMMELTA